MLFVGRVDYNSWAGRYIIFDIINIVPELLPTLYYHV